MHYVKMVSNGYILSVGKTDDDWVSDNRISKEEHDELVEMLNRQPSAPEGYVYMLRADTLEWELFELPPMPEDDELSAEEALEIITGGYAE